jgi:ElaB/YqjD/DUF883 family membrane-anchored ribosome-binding protein
MVAAASTAPEDEGVTSETSRLRESIAETREQIGSTIEALQEKLSPSVLAEQAKTAVREATIGKVENMVHEAEETITLTTYSLYDSVRRNPVPVVMAGIGLTWFFLSRRRDRYRGEYIAEGEHRHPGGERIATRVRRAASEAVEKAEHIVEAQESKVTEAARGAKEAAHEAKEKVKRVAHDAGQSARRMENRVEDMYYQNPLAAGAIAIAAGTAVGLAIPISRKEDEWLGPARDKLVGKANELAHQALGKVEDTARKVEGVAHDIGENVSQALGEGGTQGARQGGSPQLSR